MKIHERRGEAESCAAASQQRAPSGGVHTHTIDWPPRSLPCAPANSRACARTFGSPPSLHEHLVHRISALHHI
jgi:hypothetical protein